MKLVVQYEGTAYAGFQRQKGLPTVQEELEKALAVCCGEPVAVVGAGRTDAGVHARGQVVSFFTGGTIPTDRIPWALATLLPPDIVVTAAEEVPPTFHARFSARGKVYTYTFWVATFPSPFWRRYALHVRGPLHRAAMEQAAAALVGRHDFRAFRGEGSAARTTVRTLRRLDLEEGPGGPVLRLVAEADGFLYHMVRTLAGTLLEVGRGRMPPEQVEQALRTGDRALAGPTLPAHGLCLEQVIY
ncbi:MAG: tRNA pseudouridine(38-40) synthase TruA [Bacillota bacterium]|nr:tRNA pseudouridine(38-40) synthase TruA [Bacillota bacterium]